MAELCLQGTKFTWSILPTEKTDFFVKTEMGVANESLSYTDVGAYWTREDIEEFLRCASRLLAGGYEKEYSLSFERAGLAADFYAYTENGEPVPRLVRRERECTLALRMLFRSADKKQFLGGVYTLLLRRRDIEALRKQLQAEFATNCLPRSVEKGAYAFVGVSPFGYTGCGYWYIDPTGEVKAGEYVWVRMGRHDREQIVYVDVARRFNEEDAPYNPRTVKQVLRRATKEEVDKFFSRK